MRIEYHRTLIADRVRNAAIDRALRAAIVPGQTVVSDIGAGTGLIGLMAARLGARRVYLYESEAVAGVAARVAKANRARNVEIIAGHSAEIIDPPKADLVVSETLGNYALEENIVATLADARKRHLAPGGTMIPQRIAQFVAPVVTDREHKGLTVWDEVRRDWGIDLSLARTMSLNNIYVRRLATADLWPHAAPVTWDRVELGRDTKSSRAGEARWPVGAPVSVYGFAVWWQAELAPGVILSTAPDAPATHWEQLYLPLLEPIAAAGGDALGCAIRSRSSYDAGTHIAWTVTLTGGDGRVRTRQALDLDKGYLP